MISKEADYITQEILTLATLYGQLKFNSNMLITGFM